MIRNLLLGGIVLYTAYKVQQEYKNKSKPQDERNKDITVKASFGLGVAVVLSSVLR